MKTPAILGVALWVCTVELCGGEAALGGNTTLKFATVKEGKQILTTSDDFIKRLSAFDRSARMKTTNEVSQEEFLNFVGTNVLAWSDDEKRMLELRFQALQPRLEMLPLSFPKVVSIVKTAGNEEGKAAYTRGAAIVLPQNKLSHNASALDKLLCHELFHILSRTNPDLREKLYEVIGFTKCDEVEFPVSLKSRKITNPDAPRNDHFIRVSVNGRASLAVPILFSSVENFDPARGGEFFDYLQFRLLLVEKNDGSSVVALRDDGARPTLVEPQTVSGFMEQVGNNTRYVIHPEEILADNFALLVMGEGNLSSPEIVQKMRRVLMGQ